jgi:hypothetical protein
MKKTVWTFGLIAGAIMSLMMVVSTPFHDRIGFDTAEVIGYTTIIAAFLLVFFGIRSYRDKQAGRSISFLRALTLGVLINLVASACYVATWQFVSTTIAPDFGEKYAAHILEKERASGATPQQLEARRAQMERYREMLKNPLVNMAFSFLEPFSIGLIVSLVSAGILRKRPDEGAAEIAREAGSALGALV